MLSPSDRKNITANALKILNNTEGVGTSTIEDMVQLLAHAEEEEAIYQMEQEEQIKPEAEYWEQREDDYIQQKIDIARGK